MLKFLTLKLIFILPNIYRSECVKNSAYYRIMHMCSGHTGSTLTDGDRLTVHIIKKPERCPMTFQMDFDESHKMKYIIIYTGEQGPITTPYHSLDYAEVLCGRIGKQFICAVPPTRIKMIKHMLGGVRFNLIHEDAQRLKVQFSKDIDEISLTEIEIYTRETDDAIHRGCFIDVFSREHHHYEGFDKCKRDCNNHAFGISKAQKSCLCLREINFDKEVSLLLCDSKCDEGLACGGNSTHSIYIKEYHVPSYSGCHEEDLTREVIREYYTITFSRCLHYCRNNWVFFTKEKCMCTAYNTSQILNHTLLCDNPCVFDEEVTCGGESAVSFYTNCKISGNILCKNLLNCKEALFDHNGICIYGCKSGFVGDHCMEKVFDPIPDEPDEQTATTEDDGSKSTVTHSVSVTTAEDKRTEITGTKRTTPTYTGINNGTTSTMSIHTESIHTESIHNESIHTESIHTESIHTESIHTESIYATPQSAGQLRTFSFCLILQTLFNCINMYTHNPFMY